MKSIIPTAFFAGCLCAASVSASPLTFEPVTNKASAPVAAAEKASPAAKTLAVKPAAATETASLPAKTFEVKPIAAAEKTLPPVKTLAVKPVASKETAPPPAKRLALKPVESREKASPLVKTLAVKPVASKETAPPPAKRLALKPVEPKEKTSPPVKAFTTKPIASKEKASLPAKTLAIKPVASTEKTSPPARTFVVKDARGRGVSVPLVDDSAKRKIVASVDPSINPTMIRAATIAQERSYAHSKSRCWRFVKQALFAAGAVSSYPKTALAKQAGDELVRDFGFRKLPVRDPYAAPIGAVLVYGGRGAGHVEIRNKTGFVSDFRNEKPSKRRLIGVFAKA